MSEALGLLGLLGPGLKMAPFHPANALYNRLKITIIKRIKITMIKRILEPFN